MKVPFFVLGIIKAVFPTFVLIQHPVFGNGSSAPTGEFGPGGGQQPCSSRIACQLPLTYNSVIFEWYLCASKAFKAFD